MKVNRCRVSSYRISQLAERSGVPASTLRFYENLGLLPAERTTAGYRLYDDTALERLAFIASAKHLGLGLEEIRDLLGVRDQGVCAAVRERLAPLVAARIADADRRIAEVSAFTAHLARVHQELTGPAPMGACGPDCGCTTTTQSGPMPVALTRTRPEPSADQARRPAPVMGRSSWPDCFSDGSVAQHPRPIFLAPTGSTRQRRCRPRPQGAMPTVKVG